MLQSGNALLVGLMYIHKATNYIEVDALSSCTCDESKLIFFANLIQTKVKDVGTLRWHDGL